MEIKVLNKKVGCALIAASLLAASSVQGSGAQVAERNRGRWSVAKDGTAGFDDAAWVVAGRNRGRWSVKRDDTAWFGDAAWVVAERNRGRWSVARDGTARFGNRGGARIAGVDIINVYRLSFEGLYGESITLLYPQNCMANFDPKGNDIRISIFPNDGNFTSIIAQGFPGYTLHHFVLGDKQVMVRVYDPSMTVTPSRQGIFITPPTKKANREVTFNILGMPPEHKLSEIEEERRAMM